MQQRYVLLQVVRSSKRTGDEEVQHELEKLLQQGTEQRLFGRLVVLEQSPVRAEHILKGLSMLQSEKLRTQLIGQSQCTGKDVEMIATEQDDHIQMSPASQSSRQTGELANQ